MLCSDEDSSSDSGFEWSYYSPVTHDAEQVMITPPTSEEINPDAPTVDVDNSDNENGKTCSNPISIENDENDICSSKESNADRDSANATSQSIFGDLGDMSDDDCVSKASFTETENDSVEPTVDLAPLNSPISPKEDFKSPSTSPEPVEIPETRIDTVVAKNAPDLGNDIFFVKLPNFLSTESKPFNRETYDDELADEEVIDEEGRQRIKLKISNTMRWRELQNKNGEKVKESNTRLVKWSDGTTTLHVGNEVFDTFSQNIQNDHNHLFVRQRNGLEGQAVFTKKLTFRPHSTESFTHKKMTMSVADRSQKAGGVKILTKVGRNPLENYSQRIKMEEEKLRNNDKKSKYKNKAECRKDEEVAGPSGLSNPQDGSDDDNTISLNAIKNKYKKKKKLNNNRQNQKPKKRGPKSRKTPRKNSRK